MKRAGWQPPPWFEVPAARIAFLHQLRELAEVRRGGDGKYSGGLVVSFTLTPQGVASRRVTVRFRPRSPESPNVYVDGPNNSPHRYDDGSLCMWFPRDPPEMRWTPKAGAADLVTRIAVHLIKEEWFRRTGEWVGEEVQHHRRDDANDAEGPA